jgi:hypothetical protein
MSWLIRKAFFLFLLMVIFFFLSALWSGGAGVRRVCEVTDSDTCNYLAGQADEIKSGVDSLFGRLDKKKKEIVEKARGEKR